MPRPTARWARFILGLGAIVGAKFALDGWYDARWAVWQRYVSRGTDDQWRLRESLFGKAPFDDPGLLRRLPTWGEVSSQFGLRRDACRAAGEDVFIYALPGEEIDPETSPGWVVTFLFHDDKLERVSLKPPPPPRTPPPASVRAWSVRIGLALAFLGAVAWTGAFLSALTEPRRSDSYGQVALAGAVTALVGCALWSGIDNQLEFAGTMGLVYVSAAMAFAALGVREGLFRRADASEAEARCRTCGYDLYGNASGVCPECGTVTRRHLRDVRAERLSALAYNVALAAEGETVADED